MDTDLRGYGFFVERCLASSVAKAMEDKCEADLAAWRRNIYSCEPWVCDLKSAQRRRCDGKDVPAKKKCLLSLVSTISRRVHSSA